MVQINFDANQVAPNTGYEPLPEGWYNVAIDASEVKPTRDGEGAYLQLTAKVIDGPHTGKPVFIRLNIQNKNQQAVDIAYGELSAICHVTGVYQVADSSQLHGIPFQVRVTVRTSKDENGNASQSNDVKGYKDAAGNEPGKSGGAAQGGGQPSNFGGQSQGQGQPQNNGAPQGQGGWGGQPQGQPQGNPAQGGNPAWGGQPQGNPQGQPDPNAGQGQPQNGGNPAWGQGQPQGDPNAGQQPPQGQGGNGAPAWGGGQPAQGAQQPQGQPQGQGNAGWTQGGGNPQGGAPWGQNNGG